MINEKAKTNSFNCIAIIKVIVILITTDTLGKVYEICAVIKSLL